jgi:hypothetical protein
MASSAYWDKHRWESLRSWYDHQKLSDTSFENLITSFSVTSTSAYATGASIFFKNVMTSSLSTFPNTFFGRSLSLLLTSIMDWKTIHGNIKREVPREQEERERERKNKTVF